MDDALEITLYDLNYIPEYKLLEEQRRTNEQKRQENEVERQTNEIARQKAIEEMRKKIEDAGLFTPEELQNFLQSLQQHTESIQDIESEQVTQNNSISILQTNLETKADKAIVKRFSIDTTEWTHDATTNTYTHTIAGTAIKNTELELIDVYYDTESKEVAQDAEIKTSSAVGQLIFTATSVPNTAITGTYKVEG